MAGTYNIMTSNTVKKVRFNGDCYYIFDISKRHRTTQLYDMFLYQSKFSKGIIIRLINNKQDSTNYGFGIANRLNNINPVTGGIGKKIRWDLLLRRLIGK